MLVVNVSQIDVHNLKEQVLRECAGDEDLADILEINDASQGVVDPFKKFERLLDREGLMVEHLSFEFIQFLFKMGHTFSQKLRHP